jgi:hypothetical protein
MNTVSALMSAVTFSLTDMVLCGARSKDEPVEIGVVIVIDC